MKYSDVGGIVISLAGIGISILSPTNQIVGWCMLALGASIGLGAVIRNNAHVVRVEAPAAKEEELIWADPFFL
jgi:hypothetical protein